MSIANTQSETIVEAGIIENNDQVEARIEHLKALENIVGNSYPNKYERSRITGAEDTISNILAFEPVTELVKQLKENTPEGEKPDQDLKSYLNEKLKQFGNVRISGRLAVPPRVMGKAAFVHLSDGKKRLQIYVRKQDVLAISNDTGKPLDEEGKAWEVFGLVDHGDFLGAEGYLFLTNTGELSVHVETIQFLSKSLLPMPDKMHGIADPELQRRFRYADLIASSLQIEHETGELTTREVFERRAKLISGMRRYLDAHDFIEVETPMLTPKATGAAAEPFETFHKALGIPLYARIAPELYLKRLTVGGFEKVYELNRNFRNEGLSQRHNPEFTMLEFYCAYMDVNGMMDFAEAMIKESVYKATRDLKVQFNDKTISFGTFKILPNGDVQFGIHEFERLTMKQAIIRYWNEEQGEITDVEFNPLWFENAETLFRIIKHLMHFYPWDLRMRQRLEVESSEILEKENLDKTSDVYQEKLNQLLADGEKEILEVHKGNWEHYFNGTDLTFDFPVNTPNEIDRQIAELFEILAEPYLIQPTFIIDYPKSISPLSKASPENPNIAERFELFINGMEVANGFSELNDPQEQYERFVDQMMERETGDAEAMVLDEDYIRALAYGMPPAAGIGIGIDRLVMLLTNKHSIRDVILFPHMRPERKTHEEENNE